MSIAYRTLLASNPFTVNDFWFEVDTTKVGVTASNAFRFPLVASGPTQVDCVIHWGDGSTDTLYYNGTNPGAGNVSEHTYAVGGVYQIRTVGQFDNIWAFTNAGDRLKFMKVFQWGNNRVNSGQTNANFLYGCENLSLSQCTDALNFSVGTTNQYFRNNLSLTNIPFLELYNTFNIGKGSFASSNFFMNCPLLNEDFGKWDFSGMTKSMAGFFTNSPLSVANYDSTLLKLKTQKALLFSAALLIDFGICAHSYNKTKTGTQTAVLANKLIVAGENFLSTVSIGDAVRNSSIATDSPTSFAIVVSVDSDTQLTLNADIFATGSQNFQIFNDLVTKGKAEVISEKLWTLNDATTYV